MPVSLNTNTAAALAVDNVAATSRALERTLATLSTGSKLVVASDDAGGQAVALKLSAAARRQSAVAGNLGNAASCLQTQDGALSLCSGMLARIGELQVLASDPTKSTSDFANYASEFTQLQSAIRSLGDETFNGRALFGTTALTAATTEDGTGVVTAAGVDLLTPPRFPTAGDTFTDFARWTDTSAGTPTATASVAGQKLTLDVPGTGSASAQFQPTETVGSFALSFDFAFTAGTTNTLAVMLGGSLLATLVHGTDVHDSGSHHLLVQGDAAGSAALYLDGQYLRSENGIAENAGRISLSTSDTGSVDCRSFVVWSTKPKSAVCVLSQVSFSDLTPSMIADATDEIAGYRAQNGAAQSRIGSAVELLTANRANLQTAVSRISDVDYASASTAVARFQVLVQAGLAMIGQANASSQIALKLLAA